VGGTDGVGVGSRVGRVDGAGLGLVVGTILGVEDGFAVGRFVGTPLGAMLGMAVDFRTQPDSRLACASTPPLELFNQHTPLYGLAVPYVQNLPRTDATAASQSASHHIVAASWLGWSLGYALAPDRLRAHHATSSSVPDPCTIPMPA
jgi:hypothetical protein